MAFKLNRRTFLRGILGGAAASLALPPLEAFWNDHGTAMASGAAFPKRFGVWFWGNGIGQDASAWVPGGAGAEWTLSKVMAPLANVKGDITVISGLKVMTPNTHPHGTGPAGVLAGGPASNSGFPGPSLDQLIAEQIGGETLNRSLEVSVQRSSESMSFAEKGKSNPPEWNPTVLFDKLFGPTFRLPGQGTVDPKLGLRRSVLDAVSADATRLKARISAADRTRLEQHFENVRNLETKIAKLQADPPVLAACSKPAAPKPEYPDVEGRPPIAEISRVMADLLAMSVACDQERVFSFQLHRPVSNLLFPRANAGHHQLTHDELGEQPMVQDIVQQILGEAAYMIEAFKRVQEGDGTLLDNTCMLFTTDCSNGKAHAVDEYPIFYAGTAGGALKKGIHVRQQGKNASELGLTLLQAFGLPVTTFGSEAGKVTSTISEIRA